MCELFGVSSRDSINVKNYMEEFFAHSVRHPNGWGIAMFYDNSVSLEKEPIRANKSVYLRERLRRLPEVSELIAHIRFATRGGEEYDNAHPFVRRDNFGRAWTFAHNGTIFNYPILDSYFARQEGNTDSERILLYIIDKINSAQNQINRPLKFEERFALLDELVCDMAEGNKINFLLFDGEFMYVHSNYANTLYGLYNDHSILFSTTPLSKEDWRLVKFTTLLAYKKGELIKEGTTHGKVYKDNEKDLKMLFVDYSSL